MRHAAAAVAAARRRCVRVAASAAPASGGLQALIFDCDGAVRGAVGRHAAIPVPRAASAAACLAAGVAARQAARAPPTSPHATHPAAGVIVESEDIHRLAYNATFAHFDVRCPGGEGPVVWTEEYYEDLQNRVGGQGIEGAECW